MAVGETSGRLAGLGYRGRTPAAELFTRLVAAPRGATGHYGAAQVHITRALLALLTTLNEQIKTLTAEIGHSSSRCTPTSRSSPACDKQLRDAVCDFAGDTRHANPWAAELYQRARDRGHDHPHAVRILARAWLFVIWHCWQDHTAYDPNKHRALQRLLSQDHQAAA